MYSRNEQYLEACCNKSGIDELPKPVSRNETLLYRLAEELSKGIIIRSSTSSSTKQFRITVDDTGELSTTDGDGNSVSISDLIDAKLGVIENGTY